MNRFFILIVTGVLFPLSLGMEVKGQPAASEPPVNAAVTALIDKLQDVAEPDTGYSPYDSGLSFAPLNQEYEVGGQLLSPRRPSVVSEAMRELVRLGPAAVPDLLRHLDDKRPTRLTVRHTFGGLGGFSINVRGKEDGPKAYTLKVGDLCYVALGQIVNRPYVVAQYQPTAFIMVFTPTRDPKTCAKLRKEWGTLTAEQHRASLLKDCQRKGAGHVGAFLRLSYYYPEALEAPALAFLAKASSDMATADTMAKARVTQALGYGSMASLNKPSGRLSIDDITKVISNGLIYDRSTKIDRVIRAILATTENDWIMQSCMTRLVGRGYDADLEANYSRRERQMHESFKSGYKAFLAKAGWTPLHVAVWRGHRERITELLREGANVSAPGKDGRTPLHVAAIHGNTHAVPVLCAAGAEQSARDRDGRTPVGAASHAGDTAMVQTLLKAGSPIPDILVAATSGNSKQVARFLETDQTTRQARDSLGMTPLHRAALEGHTEVLKQLLDNNFGPELSDSDGLKPLHYAAAMGQEKACRLLVQYKANVFSTIPSNGAEPIHLAAHNGNLNVVQLLVKHGAKIDAYDAKQTTPLHFAASQGHLAVVQWLVGQKADVNARNKDGWTARIFARQGGHRNVVQWLESNGAEADPYSPFDDW